MLVIERRLTMRKALIALGAAIAIATATPAMAYDSADLISMQQALDVATSLGLVTVSDAQFAGDEWQIEGRDFQGHYMEVDVDARTGEVRNVDR
jgi:Peptidase propeptide and YPEB domain